MSVSIYGSGQTVLQVVQASLVGTAISTSSTSFVTTGFSVSITPQSTNSKILAMINGGCGYTGSSGQALYSTIYRGGTNLGDATYGLERIYAAGTATLAPHSMSILDSPSTTSSTTYTAYFRSAGGTVDFSNTDRGTVTFTLLEISGS